MSDGDHEDDPLAWEAAAEVVPRATDPQVVELQDRLLRAQAELDNFRKRAGRELDEARRYREIDLLRDLLPVLDNIARAIEAARKTTDPETLRSGFEMTAVQIEKLLADHGCRPIETDGKPFDPLIHEAILEQPVAGMAAGTVVATANRGYTLHERVVRPAQVIVSR